MFTTKMVGFTSKNDLQGWVAVGIEDDENVINNHHPYG